MMNIRMNAQLQFTADCAIHTAMQNQLECMAPCCLIQQVLWAVRSNTTAAGANINEILSKVNSKYYF